MPLSYRSLQNWGAPWQTASGTILNTAATQTISPQGSGGTGDDPQIYSFYQGAAFYVSARGVYTMGSTATNATFALFASTTNAAASAGVSLATTGALALPVSVTGLLWELEALIQVRNYASGAATNSVATHGRVIIQTATPSGTTGNEQVWPMPATSGPTTSQVDVSIAHTIALVGTLSQITGGPSITCTNFLVEPLAT